MTTATTSGPPGGSTTAANRGPVRRLLLTDAEIGVLDRLRPGRLPVHLIRPGRAGAAGSIDETAGAVGAGLDGPVPVVEEVSTAAAPEDFETAHMAALDEEVEGALVARGVLTRTTTGPGAQVVSPLAYSLDLLADPASVTVDLTVAGAPPADPPPGQDTGGGWVGLRAWIATRGPAAVALAKVGEQTWELSAFLAGDQAVELQDLIPPASAFGSAHTIAEALLAPKPDTSEHRSGGPDGTADAAPLPGDDPQAVAITAAARSALRATVITTTLAGPGAGVLSWIGDEHRWWAVDADWRRWARTGERHTVLTPIPPDQTGHTFTTAIDRLIRAAHSLTPPTPQGGEGSA